jgi:hypothetical protein
MGGGLMQLVAYGAQDIYLTGNPQITFFKVVYRRHTNFSMESIKQTKSGGGSQLNWTIARNGDLILNMFLEGAKWDLTTNGQGQISATDKYTGNAGKERPAREFLNSKLDTMRYSIEIGGQCIDRFDNLYRRTFNCLNEVNPVCDEQTLLLRMEELGIYNLPFWFCRNPGLALPLIALQYHEVKFILELNKAASNTDIKWVGSGSDPSGLDLWVDYVYLDTDERRRFAQVSHEYLIEQVQTSNFSVSGTDCSLDLNFNHPVKELIWVCLDDNQYPTWHNIYNNDSKSTSVQLILNGQDRFAKRVARYFSQLQVWQYHSGYGSLTTGDVDMDFLKDGNEDVDNKQEQNFVTQPVYVYSFALKPEEHQPSGTCNFSRIDSASLNFSGLSISSVVVNGVAHQEVTADVHNLVERINEPKSIKVFAVNYNVLRIMSGMGGLAYSN